MNPNIKQSWLDALRSGKYTKGVGALHYRSAESSTFCCLGVLSDLAAKVGEGSWAGSDDGAILFIDPGATHDEEAILTRGVVRWAGLGYASNPQVRIPSALAAQLKLRPEDWPRSNEGTVTVELATLNDRGLTFAQIADLIEEQL